MIIRLGRLTPGYFRLLQRQVAGEVQTQPQDRTVNQIAMMLAIMGLSLSYYSAKQMTEKVQAPPAPWRKLTTLIMEIMDEPMRNEGGGARRQTQGRTFLTTVTLDTGFLWSLPHHARRFQGCCKVFTILSVVWTLSVLWGSLTWGHG